MVRVLTRLLCALAACVFILATLSCASSLAFSRARSSLRRGDRVDAVLFSAEALSHSPSNYKAMALLEAIFPQAVEQCKAEAEAALARSDPARWETVARDWRAIHAMDDAVSSLPPLYHKGSEEPLGFSFTYNEGLLSEALDKAAEYRYEEALKLLSSGSRGDARAAYASLQKAQSFRQGYKDSDALLSQAWEAGSDKVAVIPFDSDIRTPDSLAFLDMLYEDSQSSLAQLARTRDFLEVEERGEVEATLARQGYSGEDLARPQNSRLAQAGFGANILVIGRLLRFSIEQPRTRTRSEDSRVDSGSPPRDDRAPDGGQRERRSDKSGTITIFSRRASIRCLIEYRAVDIERSVVLDSRRLSEELHDDSEWATWKGDREAIPDKYAKLVDSGQAPPPDYKELARRLAWRIAGELTASFIGTR